MDTTSGTWASGSTLDTVSKPRAADVIKRLGIRLVAGAVQSFAAVLIVWCALPALVLFGLCLFPALIVPGILMAVLHTDAAQPTRAPLQKDRFSRGQHHPHMSGPLPA